MADTNLLGLGVDELFLELHQGLVEQDSLRVEVAAKTAEQHWAFAVARRERSKLRALNENLTQAAMTAEAIGGGGLLAQRWSSRWQALSEVGDLVLAADTGAVTGEDRALLREFDHAESIIETLQRRHLGTVASLQQHLALSSLQACRDHLNRLVRHGLVVQLSEGEYGLSPRGERVADLLAQEKSTQLVEHVEQQVREQGEERGSSQVLARGKVATSGRQAGREVDETLSAALHGVAGPVHGRSGHGVERNLRRDERHLVRVFKALSDGTRQEILRLLEGQQRTVGEIVGNFNLSQPTISRHLSVLKEAELIVDQRRDQIVVYRLNDKELSDSMQEFFGQFRSCQEVGVITFIGDKSRKSHRGS